MYNVKYAIIISMNEEGNGATAPQAQNQAPVQPAKPTSAVNAGFDASKIGSGKKHKPEKVKKVKEKKDKETKKTKQSLQNSSRVKTKRPLWFWIVLGILGFIILAVAIWAITTLVHFASEGDIATTLILDENPNNNEAAENETVNNYVAQLQKIYDANSDNGSNNVIGMEKVNQAVDDALKSKQGEAQAGSIQIAAMAVAYQNSAYDRVISLADKINPDTLSLQDQITYYATLYAVYDTKGETEKAQEAFKIEGEKIQQLCSMQECMQ